MANISDPMARLLIKALDREFDDPEDPVIWVDREIWTIKPTVSRETCSVEEDLRTLSEYPVSALNSRSLCVLAAFNLKISGERVSALLSTLAKVQTLLTSILEE